MKKLAALIFVTFLMISGMLCACDAKEEEPFDEAYYQVSKTYITYLETGMKDWPKAVKEFVNLESVGDKEELKRVLSDEPVLAYEILRVEKLSESLWVVEGLIKTESIPYGVYGVNYVGYMNGKWEVFLNERGLPATLTDGIEIPHYETHAADIPNGAQRDP